MSGKSAGSIACAAAQVPLISERSTCRAWRPLSLLGSHGANYRRSGLAPRSPSRLGGSRTMRRQPPRSKTRSNSQHGASPPQNGQRARLARCRPTVLPAMPGHKRHSSPGRLDAHSLLHDGTYPRRPCPPHPPVMLVTIAAGPEPRCSSPTELGAVAARCEHCRSHRPCHTHSISSGRPAISSGHTRSLRGALSGRLRLTSDLKNRAKLHCMQVVEACHARWRPDPSCGACWPIV